MPMEIVEEEVVAENIIFNKLFNFELI